MEIDFGSCHLAISGDRLSSTYGCHPISWIGLRKSKRRKRGLEEEVEEGALQEAEEDVDGEVARAEEEVQEVQGAVGEVKGGEEEAKVEVGEAKDEGAEVAGEEEDGDRKKSRERGWKMLSTRGSILKPRRLDSPMVPNNNGATSSRS